MQAAQRAVHFRDRRKWRVETGKRRLQCMDQVQRRFQAGRFKPPFIHLVPVAVIVGGEITQKGDAIGWKSVKRAGRPVNFRHFGGTPCCVNGPAAKILQLSEIKYPVIIPVQYHFADMPQ